MFRLNLVSRAAVLVPVLSLCLGKEVQAQGSEQQQPSSPATVGQEMVGVFLKPQSKELVSAFLTKKGIKNTGAEYITIYSTANEEDSYIFRPLFGERAAFRVTGLLTLEDGRTVATGRLSNMIGEVKIDDREMAMPLFRRSSESSQSSSSLSIVNAATQSLMDAPTVLSKSVPQARSMHHWKGRLPATTVGTVHYPAQRAQFVQVPKAEQIVVEGFICSNKFCSEDGTCEYDRSAEVEDSLVLKDSKEQEKKLSVVKAEVAHTEGEEEETCPVCRYMKGGPCKDEFKAWDNCIKDLKENQELRDCFAVTKTMMMCMKDHEYYDIMTAGTDYSKLEFAVQPASSPAPTVHDGN
jgi:hypothetical protein